MTTQAVPVKCTKLIEHILNRRSFYREGMMQWSYLLHA